MLDEFVAIQKGVAEVTAEGVAQRISGMERAGAEAIRTASQANEQK
ncbi:MAG TPA: hypothetical protein VF767_07120 [Bryobacteraceae bacterium]